MQKNMKFLIFLSAISILVGCGEAKIDNEVTDSVVQSDTEEAEKLLDYNKPDNNYNAILRKQNSSSNAEITIENYKTSDLTDVKVTLVTDMADSDYNYYTVNMVLSKDLNYLQKCYGTSSDNIIFTEIQEIDSSNMSIPESLDIVNNFSLDCSNPEFINDGTVDFVEDSIPVTNYTGKLKSMSDIDVNVAVDKQNSYIRELNYKRDKESVNYEVHNSSVLNLDIPDSIPDFDDCIDKESADVEIVDMYMQFMSAYSTDNNSNAFSNEEDIIQ